MYHFTAGGARCITIQQDEPGVSFNSRRSQVYHLTAGGARCIAIQQEEPRVSFNNRSAKEIWGSV